MMPGRRCWACSTVLNLAKIDAGEFEAELHPFDIEQVVRRATATVGSLPE